MIKSIDHIVLPASDLKRTITFYCDALGMELQQFMPPDGSAERLTLIFGQQKINLHDATAPFSPHVHPPTTDALDLCFLSDVGRQTGSRIWQRMVLPLNRGLYPAPVPLDRSIRSMSAIPDGNLVKIGNPA